MMVLGIRRNFQFTEDTFGQYGAHCLRLCANQVIEPRCKPIKFTECVTSRAASVVQRKIRKAELTLFPRRFDTGETGEGAIRCAVIGLSFVWQRWFVAFPNT